MNKARCIIQSWLLSWGVPYEQSGDGLMVDGHSISFGPGGEVEVDVEAVLSKSFERSIEEARRLMSCLGRVPSGLERIPPTRRAHADDLLARSMKLTAFAKAPNPPEALMKEYLPIVKREANRAWRRCTTLNQSLLLEPGDYLCVGMVFLVNYLHRYQDLSNESRNRANLTLYLQQEFAHWDKVLHHDLPEFSVDPRGLLPEQFMQAPVPGSTIEWRDTWSRGSPEKILEPSYTMPEYLEQAAEEPAIYQEGELPHHLLPELLTSEEHAAHVKRCPACSSEKASTKEARQRAQRAKNELVERLDGLEHDDLVEALGGVMSSPYCDPDARRLATTLFHNHMASCGACSDAWQAWGEERAHRRKYVTKADRDEVGRTCYSVLRT